MIIIKSSLKKKIFPCSWLLKMIFFSLLITTVQLVFVQKRKELTKNFVNFYC